MAGAGRRLASGGGDDFRKPPAGPWVLKGGDPRLPSASPGLRNASFGIRKGLPARFSNQREELGSGNNISKSNCKGRSIVRIVDPYFLSLSMSFKRFLHVSCRIMCLGWNDVC